MIGKSILLARSNLRKSKGQAVAIVVLIVLASMLLNIWFMLSFDYKQNFDRFHEKLNAEHVTAIFNSRKKELKDFLAETLEKDKRAVDYSMNETLWFEGTIDYNGGTLSTSFFALEKEAALAKEIGCYEITEDGAYTSGVYLPMLYASGDNYAIGDVISIQIREKIKQYKVCGFFNNIMAGSHNCGICGLMLTKDVYKSLAESGDALESTLLSVRIQDKSDSENFEAGIKDKAAFAFPEIAAIGNSYTSVSTSRYISQMICSGIVSAMAFFVTLISLVVISSNTAHFIRENMKNLGALKAIGYTGKQLVISQLIQFLLLSSVAQIFGIAASYALFPKINEMMISQTGIPYQIRFLLLPFLAAITAVSGTVALTVWFSSRKIQMIEPVTALRKGILTHNFMRNPIPLAHTWAPLNLALAFKTMLLEKKQNITVCVTMFVLSLVLVFSGLMLKNVIFDVQPMVDLIVGETSDASVSVAAEYGKEFVREMEHDKRVEKVYLYNDIEVRHVGHVALNAIVTDDCTLLNNRQLCVEGRFPKYDNEILIGAKYANEQGLKVGDTITLAADGTNAEYILCGLTQTSNYLGKDCLMLKSAFERMGRLGSECYYLNLAKNTEVDAFLEEVLEAFSGSVMMTVNIQEVIDGTASVYVHIIIVIVCVCVALSLIVIAFVLFLLVRTLLAHKKRDYGILKSLGFTTGQLILQTAMSFMPSLILSTGIGIGISVWVINPLIALFLKGIGVIKCTFEIPLGLITAFGFGMIAVAFFITCFLAFCIRKITPRALLSDE